MRQTASRPVRAIRWRLRPGPSAHRTSAATGQGLRYGQRPPQDHQESTQPAMIRAVAAPRPAPPHRKITNYCWSIKPFAQVAAALSDSRQGAPARRCRDLMTDGASPRRCNEASDRTAVAQDRICPSGSSALAASPRALPAAAPPTGYTWAATAGSSNAASPGCTPSNGSAPATNTAPTSTWACSPAPRHRRNESTSSVRVLGRLCGRHRPGERLPQPPDGLQIGRGGGLPPLAGSLPGLGVHLLVAGLVHPVVQQLVDLVQAGDVVAGRVAVPGDLY